MVTISDLYLITCLDKIGAICFCLSIILGTLTFISWFVYSMETQIQIEEDRRFLKRVKTFCIIISICTVVMAAVWLLIPNKQEIYEMIRTDPDGWEKWMRMFA